MALSPKLFTAVTTAAEAGRKALLATLKSAPGAKATAAVRLAKAATVDSVTRLAKIAALGASGAMSAKELKAAALNEANVVAALALEGVGIAQDAIEAVRAKAVEVFTQIFDAAKSAVKTKPATNS